MEHMPKRIERTTIYESEHVCLYTDKENRQKLLQSVKQKKRRAANCRIYNIYAAKIHVMVCLMRLFMCLQQKFPLNLKSGTQMR